MSASRDSAASGPDHADGPASMRYRIERSSAPALMALSRLPVLVPFLVMLALMLTGAFVGGPLGGALLLLPVAFLLWLLFLTWPHLRRPERVMRGAVLLLVVAIAVTQLVPRG